MGGFNLSLPEKGGTHSSSSAKCGYCEPLDKLKKIQDLGEAEQGRSSL